MKYELWNCRKRNTNSQIKQISFEVFLESLKRSQLPQPDWQTVPCIWTGKIKSRPGEFNCSCSWNGQHTSWCRSQLRPTLYCHRRHAVSSEIHRGHFMLTHISHCTELIRDSVRKEFSQWRSRRMASDTLAKLSSLRQSRAADRSTAWSRL